jgi:hypothetical protein
MQTPLENQPESQRITTVPEEGSTFGIQATTLTKSEKDIITEPLPFKEVTDSIESIAKAVLTTLQKVKPRSASVEFGIEIALSDGKLFAIVAKGDAKANMKITLEWGETLPAGINDGEQTQEASIVLSTEEKHNIA